MPSLINFATTKHIKEPKGITSTFETTTSSPSTKVGSPLDVPHLTCMRESGSGMDCMLEEGSEKDMGRTPVSELPEYRRGGSSETV